LRRRKRQGAKAERTAGAQSARCQQKIDHRDTEITERKRRDEWWGLRPHTPGFPGVRGGAPPTVLSVSSVSLWSIFFAPKSHRQRVSGAPWRFAGAAPQQKSPRRNGRGLWSHPPKRREKTVLCPVVALGALETLVALLGFEAQGRDRAGLEALDADRLGGLH